MSNYRESVERAASYLRGRISEIPSSAVILGTGLSGLGDAIEQEVVIPYADIPSFPQSTVASHVGNLIFGRLAGTPILALQGRFHLYEGYSAQEITLPIRVLALAGVTNLVISNAAGGMNPDYRRGDIMLLTDHINLQGSNPLEGPNIDDWGPRFPDMSQPYDAAYLDMATSLATDLDIDLKSGVYVAVSGPNLETRAEYRMLARLGADAVGMSTVAEVLVARHMNMRVAAFSVITDECFPDSLEPVSIEDVLAAAADAEPRLRILIERLVPGL